MTDFYREQYEHWFAEACRRSELIGAITFYTEAALSTDSTDPANRYVTPSRAVREIRRLLAEFKTSTDTGEAVNGHDRAAA
jgi:hypothetical protein